MSSPESPSRFIYERNPSISGPGDEDTDLSNYPPSLPRSEDWRSEDWRSEDWPGTPEYYDRFSPAQHHNHAQFADDIPREAPMAAGPYSRDVTPYERASEQDDSSTITSPYPDDSVSEHVAHALHNPGIRRLNARQVHDICLGASQDFIQNFRDNIEQRLSELQDNESRGFPNRISIFNETARSLYTSTHMTASLTTNATAICSILWARGNALQMLSPESVSRAIANMDMVNRAAEDIARISNIALEGGDVREVEVRNVLQAGIEFCKRLEDQDGCETLEHLAHGFSVSADLSHRFLGSPD